jgi:hypothetical protein
MPNNKLINGPWIIFKTSVHYHKKMDFDKTQRDPRLIEPPKIPNTTTQRIFKKNCGFIIIFFNSC